MKIYIVTSGSYSDYMIEKVFLDKEKAERYISTSESYYDVREIEEFETSDDILFEAYHYIDVSYHENSPFFEDDVSFKIRKTNSLNDKVSNLKSNYLSRYDGDRLEFFIKRPIFGSYDEKHLEKKYTKVCYDLAFRIKHLIEVEGWTLDMTKTWFNTNVEEILNAE